MHDDLHKERKRRRDSRYQTLSQAIRRAAALAGLISEVCEEPPEKNTRPNHLRLIRSPQQKRPST